MTDVKLLLLYSNHHHHHHGVPLAWIYLTLSHQSSLSSIALGRSSRQHPVSVQSCYIYIYNVITMTRKSVKHSRVTYGTLYSCFDLILVSSAVYTVISTTGDQTSNHSMKSRNSTTGPPDAVVAGSISNGGDHSFFKVCHHIFGGWEVEIM